MVVAWRGCRDFHHGLLGAIETRAREWHISTEIALVSSIRKQFEDFCAKVDSEIAEVAGSHLPASNALIQQLRQFSLGVARAVLAEVDIKTEELEKDITEIAGKALNESARLLGMSRPGDLRIPHLGYLPEFSIAGFGPELGIVTGLAVVFLSPVTAAFTAIAGLILGEDMKRKRIAKKRKALRDGISYNAQQVKSQLITHFVGVIRRRNTEVTGAALTRLQTFQEDATRRLDKLGKPLAAEEEKLLQTLDADLNQLDQEFVDVATRLRQFALPS